MFVTYGFSLELWQCFVLSLSFYQQDEPARQLNYLVMWNVLVIQTMKRFLYRTRPVNNNPPRALRVMKEYFSGLPSRIVVTSTTMIYGMLIQTKFIGDMTSLNDVSIWAAIGSALLVYLVVSFLKVNMGSCFPSDCLFALAPIILIIALHYAGQATTSWIHYCPTCDDGFCYYDQIGSPCKILLTRFNFSASLNITTTVLMVLFIFISFSLLMYPLEYWNKLTYFAPTFLAVWAFQNMVLCPNFETDFSSAYDPSKSTSLPAVQQ